MCAAAKQAEEARAGSKVLSLFANPLHAEILRVHAEGPQRVSKLHEKIGWSAQTTQRAAVAVLCEAGALTNDADGTAYAVENRLTPAGEEMLVVAETLGAWLAEAPGGAVVLDSKAAKAAVKALTGGWSLALMRPLASQPYSLTELADLIPDVDIPTLERQLGKMRVSRQVERERGDGRSTPYEVTDWLRRSIAPLSVAGRCERRHMRETTAPITAVETEAAFLLTLPLVSLPATANGTCLLAAHTGAEPGSKGGRHEALSGVTVEVERGQIVACETALVKKPSTWAIGAPEAWLDAVIDGDLDELRFGGAQIRLARALVLGLHLALFGR
jgi:DNA-binding HxlR family transcriptional regulator